MSKERSKLEKRLDAIFSKFIRLRDKLTCQRCGKQFGKFTTGIQNSHFWGRRHRSTRWSENNCVALCGGCHIHLTGNPELHRQWYRGRIGNSAYDKLEYQHSKAGHFTENDLKLLLDFYTSKVNVIMKSLKWSQP
ncbi:MAG: recombination protein NinG [Candidatus Brocadiaceae bacterium]|nr:recombination protein NinG [Candidatus Brocadiaceae bacterium]